MTTPLPQSIRLGFERECVVIPLDKILFPVSLPTGIKESVAYKQILSSVMAIGLVEPVVVAPSRDGGDMFIALDGRMRVEALRDLGKEHALCLMSTDDEGYTYNKCVNRLSVVQAHRMIVRAAERGVSIQQLADALDVSPGAIRARFRLLDGICNEAVALLADKPATYGMFRILRHMKPFRQIDVAQAMTNLGNYSVKLATAMLQNTPTDQLTEATPSKSKSSTPSDTLQRLERELAAMQADTRLLEEDYGPASLQLEIIKTHIGSTLLENAAVIRWLANNQPEYLQQLQRVADIKKLPPE
ncbi:plasmid partitioning protein RepB C-terminal domain-containing protein [Achromobacter piechaudii]|uniref:RepB plasmid partitioning protein n=1 Tax=Achromobacter piechaudii ATCC 43553 TaxID=742159 RepID=D4X8Q1_9BURK|nr:plasmid partitioning protein RepB C-terminal domain-containing protein [Achromobacter piechaudii]EFF76760.1 RepB plasmid partitioning protein [Achromobacter piechaudii ATCC 43553]